MQGAQVRRSADASWAVSSRTEGALISFPIFPHTLSRPISVRSRPIRSMNHKGPTWIGQAELHFDLYHIHANWLDTYSQNIIISLISPITESPVHHSITQNVHLQHIPVRPLPLHTISLTHSVSPVKPVCHSPPLSSLDYTKPRRS
jgi:hypothetical protein